jgi:SAM-dependent methyltransferase
MVKEYIPDAYKIEPRRKTPYSEIGEMIIDRETDHWFFLTNRSLEEINHSFANIPQKVIEELKKRRREESEPLRVLDVGGGIESRASGELAEKERDQNVRVFSVDIAVRKQDQEGLHQIAGDALKLPIQNSAIDFAYSRMSVSLIVDEEPGKLFEALREVARVLKPGGIFLIDKTFTERLETLEEFKSLEKELGVVFYSKELGLFLHPIERLLNKLRHDYPDWKFIIMIKEPVDESLLKKLKLKELL